MIRETMGSEYFEWLSEIVCVNRFTRHTSFRKLLLYLHETEFRYLIHRDRNRADDGTNLRYRYKLSTGRPSYQYGPCSVLEMMVALSIRCEETIMDDPGVGDRTSQWFWAMIVNLGLGSMTDDRFDISYVEEVVERFLERDYEPDGRGGLFRIRNCDRDLRTIEIWYQLCWYLDELT